MKPNFFLFIAASLLFFKVQANEFLVSYSLDTVFTKADLKAKWKENKIKEFITPVNYDVAVYEIIYNTRWHDGSIIKASGYYYVPVDCPYKLPTMVMNHGTQLKKEMKVRLGGLQVGCIAFATDGYAALFPHYIGMGKGEKSHLYQIADSEAFANVDMLRAVRELNSELNIQLNNQLFLTGYSQGGHAAMAAHKMIEEDYKSEFKVTASAPMSGAYDMTGVQAGVMFEPYNHQAYLPYLMLSLNEKYQILEGDPYLAFKEPYQSALRGKMDGYNSLNEVSKLLPEIPSDMVNDSLIAEWKSNPNFAFTVALRDNDVYDWKPEAPMMLCFCKNDEQVTYKNAYVARDAMKENGASRIIMRSGGKKYGHNKCALFSLMNTKFFFDSFRNGSTNGSKGKVMKRMLVSIAKLAVKP